MIATREQLRKEIRQLTMLCFAALSDPYLNAKKIKEVILMCQVALLDPDLQLEETILRIRAACKNYLERNR